MPTVGRPIYPDVRGAALELGAQALATGAVPLQDLEAIMTPSAGDNVIATSGRVPTCG